MPKKNTRTFALPGQVYGRLVVIGEAERANPRKRNVVAQCECGKRLVVDAEHLRSGHTKSCGCLHIDTVIARSLRHGGSARGGWARWYSAWVAMMRRCYNPSVIGYKNWGGRGIKVCDRWHDPVLFLRDMGEPPAGMTLDRHPNIDGDYEPGNCRWATSAQQNRNRRNTIMVEFDGKRMAVIDACELLGISYELVRHRIGQGWAANDALTAPVGSRRPKEGRAA